MEKHNYQITSDPLGYNHIGNATIRNDMGRKIVEDFYFYSCPCCGKEIPTAQIESHNVYIFECCGEEASVWYYSF